jgi:hypothetical protein
MEPLEPMERERMAYVAWTGIVVVGAIVGHVFAGGDPFGIGDLIVFITAFVIWLVGVAVIFFVSVVLEDRAASRWRRRTSGR